MPHLELMSFWNRATKANCPVSLNVIIIWSLGKVRLKWLWKECSTGFSIICIDWFPWVMFQYTVIGRLWVCWDVCMCTCVCEWVYVTRWANTRHILHFMKIEIRQKLVHWCGSKNENDQSKIYHGYWTQILEKQCFYVTTVNFDVSKYYRVT